MPHVHSIADRGQTKRFCVASRSQFLDPEGGSQNATLVVLVVVVTSSLKIPKFFLIRSAAKLCIHIHAHISHRSTVSDLKLISN